MAVIYLWCDFSTFCSRLCFNKKESSDFCPHLSLPSNASSSEFLNFTLWCTVAFSCTPALLTSCRYPFLPSPYHVVTFSPAGFSLTMAGLSNEHGDAAVLRLCDTLVGITSWICRLLFVSTTLKLGPSSSAQSARGSGGPTCLRSGNWSLRPAPHNLRVVIGWRLHTTAQRLMPRNVPNTAK